VKRSDLAVGMIVEKKGHPYRGARMIVLSLEPWTAARSYGHRTSNFRPARDYDGKYATGVPVAIERAPWTRSDTVTWEPDVVHLTQIVEHGTSAAAEAHERGLRDAAMARQAAAAAEVEAVAALLPPGSGAFEYDGPRKDRTPRIVVSVDVLAGVLAALDPEAQAELVS
jgi:hypothetical protein